MSCRADLVNPAWPAPEVTAKLPLQDFLIGETLEDLLSFERCLKPRSEWPAPPPPPPPLPPRAKVHASPQEWFRIVKKGIELVMFHPIHESLIFRDHNGQKVLNGAMAVAKRKRHEDGTETILQRFITNLIPTNCYLRRLRGGSVVAGGDPNVLIYVSIGTVPTGWVAAVDLIQQVARRIVFGMAKIPPELEVKSEGLFPHDGAWVVVYLDGLDVVRAVSDQSAARSAPEAGRERLRDQCDNLKLPSTRANVLYELWVDLSWAVRLTACVVS